MEMWLAQKVNGRMAPRRLLGREAVNPACCEECGELRGADPVLSSLSVSAGETLSSPQVLSHPETGERPLPGDCRPMGHSNH